MAKVVASEGESVDSLIRKFNKKVQVEGIIAELKKREFYEKPAELRKRQKQYLEKRFQRKDEF
ncbi:MAG: 30S ribosomal protein S21 [Candidatus Woykebacteria bacterium RBG_13_40_7b]|uniref:Small ribosomal subunit protein bS21 n=1 Tax=Candidatus Woykebacteria bacterium RBG_13_40_7b TaxID=1802594 RepID=A0A1G1WB88_9BACT|nr:MAG: 30S ribosomal protein S21 [Candidatus Woykebacteria bacterium RBG_13_40_7b]